MESDLYLVAHKVHGAPAFDIACKIDCPECITWPNSSSGCFECDQLGFWWIIPTSGHRAYPFAHTIMLCHEDQSISFAFPPGEPGTMPPSLPDHYHTSTESSAPSLLSRLNLKLTPQPPIARRF